MKKLLSLLVATMVLLAAQLGTITPAYANIYDAPTHKVDSQLLYFFYAYHNLHLADGKLIASGDWASIGYPAGGTVELQIVKSFTYVGYTFNSDGTVNLGADHYDLWTPPKNVTVMRSAKLPVDKSVSFELETAGLPDGLYELQTVITEATRQQGEFTIDLFLVIYNGVPSVQVSPYPFPQIPGFWTSDGCIWY